MLLDKQHGRQDDVARSDISDAARQGCLVAAEFRGCVELQFEAGNLSAQLSGRAFAGAGQMAVQRDNDHTHRCGVSARSAIWRHKAYPL